MARSWAAASTPTRRPNTPKFWRWKRPATQARGATLYITLEPCSHQGRTPPCADALVRAGVARVIAAMEDPNPLVAGQGFRRLHEAGIAVEVASEYADEAARLNEAFIHSMRTGRPLVTLKAALTLDGKIAAPEDNTGWITSERARAHVQEIRHNADAILTGIGTVLADDCLLTDRTGLERSRPLLRIVVDSTLRIPLDSRMVASANGDVAVITTSAASDERRRALEYRGVRVLVFDGPGGRTDLDQAPRLAGRRTIPVADDRIGKQAELGGARIRHRRQDLLLLRAENPGRPAIASGGRWHRPIAAHRRHSTASRAAAFHPARRIRRRSLRCEIGGEGNCSPASSKKWAPVVGCGPANCASNAAWCSKTSRKAPALP